MRKKYFLVRLLDLLIIVALIGAYQVIALDRHDKEAAAVVKAQKEAAEQRKAAGGSVYRDGSFTGSAEGYGGTVEMKVVIKDGIIESIEKVSAPGEDAEYWSMAEGVIPEIISAQSPQVDTVSGATFSSTGIINAVVDALQKAVNE